MKINFEKIITELLNRGFTEQYLADLVTSWGVDCTQPTINRLKNGITRMPSYELGFCLVQLHRQNRQSDRQMIRLQHCN